MAVAAKVYKWWLLLLLVATWSCDDVESKRRQSRGTTLCEVAPHWTALAVSDDGGVEEELWKEPMLENRGKLVLVALTSASSGHSINQAQKLASLATYFYGIGMPDIKFILVNSAESKGHLENLKNLTITVVQEDLSKPVWIKLRGKKDYVYIYDRCGRLTYSIPFPMSIIHARQQLVESSVISTYLDDLCGDRRCGGEPANVSREDSADSELLNTTHSILIDVTTLVANMTEGVDAETQTASENEPVRKSNRRRYMDIALEENQHTDETQHKDVPTTTVAPSLFSGIWSLYKKVLNHIPWISKGNKDDDRYRNSVRKFLDQENDEKIGEEGEDITFSSDLCNATQRSTCKAWSKKRLDHARLCCKLHTCNRTAQYLQKHCKHYTEQRCKKVEIVLKCCHGLERTESNLENDERGNSRASASSHPKS